MKVEHMLAVQEALENKRNQLTAKRNKLNKSLVKLDAIDWEKGGKIAQKNAYMPKKIYYVSQMDLLSELEAELQVEIWELGQQYANATLPKLEDEKRV